jgi:hypothetical protein
MHIYMYDKQITGGHIHIKHCSDIDIACMWVKSVRARLQGPNYVCVEVGLISYCCMGLVWHMRY